jgi:hypothetical protein
MNLLKTISALICVASMLAGSAVAAEKAPAKKGTCCEDAKAEGKECSHKCCASAHRSGKSCERCNPNKEDLKKSDKKAEKQANAK